MKQLFYLGAISLACASCSRENTDPSPAAKPVAGFTVPANVKALNGISVRNTSTNATNYVWTWGDGATSTDTDPSHTYNVLGNRRLRLTANGPGGSDTISKIITITVPSAPTNVAGNYKGWLYYYNSGFRWKRDTTLTFGAVNAKTLLVFRWNAQYEDGPSANYFSSNWLGRLPNRNNYTFYAAASGKPTILQKDWASDSVYVETHVGGLASYEDYRFYGKKLP